MKVPDVNNPVTRKAMCPIKNPLYEEVASSIGIEFPLYIANIGQSSITNQTVITLAYHRRARFDCPSCGEKDLRVHSKRFRRIKHFDDLNNETIITVFHPRVPCPKCGVKTVVFGWVDRHSNVTTIGKSKADSLDEVNAT
ncbi:MAG: transposase family protein [Deltaproteobacteria bacterium]|jgi:predicted RNA-binding Zn-ribbon protein involved in translation (DUF1610 family)|nr:transposase family protein [Deltaproteobacteria bacterium]